MIDARAPMITLCLALGCGAGEPPPVSTAPPPSSEASTTFPCAVDADCRLYDGPACACLVALTTAPVTPSTTPCFAAPCMNQEAYCEAATHGCAVRRNPPSAAPSSEVPPTS